MAYTTTRGGSVPSARDSSSASATPKEWLDACLSIARSGSRVR